MVCSSLQLTSDLAAPVSVRLALSALLHDSKAGVGGIVAASAAVATALVLLQLSAPVVGALGFGGKMGPLPVSARGLLSSVAVVAPLALVFAWRRLVSRNQRPGREAAMMIGGSALYAAVLGGALAVLTDLGWVP